MSTTRSGSVAKKEVREQQRKESGRGGLKVFKIATFRRLIAMAVGKDVRVSPKSVDALRIAVERHVRSKVNKVAGIMIATGWKKLNCRLLSIEFPGICCSEVEKSGDLTKAGILDCEIRRIAHKAGAEMIAAGVYPALKEEIIKLTDNICLTALMFAKSQNSKMNTIKERHMVHAIEQVFGPQFGIATQQSKSVIDYNPYSTATGAPSGKWKKAAANSGITSRSKWVLKKKQEKRERAIANKAKKAASQGPPSPMIQA